MSDVSVTVDSANVYDFVTEILPEAISVTAESIPGQDRGEVLIAYIIMVAITLIIYVLLGLLIFKIIKMIFRRIEKKKGESISRQFLEKALELAFLMIFVVFPLGGRTFAKSLLGSTAVVAAVVGLAANDVIKDMFAGLEISLYKPFELGSRIMLEDGRAGIVEKLTLRHVVLRMIDTTRIIIPNNKANQSIIVNYSYSDNVPRSFDIRFGIGYTSDINRAKEIIRKAICECPVTLNEDKYDEDNPNSKSVYFLEVSDSALILGATVYYPFKYRTEVIKDEVNTSVFKALSENGIEIPYNYMNVIVSDNEHNGDPVNEKKLSQA